MIAQQQGLEKQENIDIYYQLFQLIYFFFQSNELLDNDFRDLDRIFVMMVFFLKENKILPPLQHIQTQKQRELQKQKYNNKNNKQQQDINHSDNLSFENKIYSKISYISVSTELIEFQQDINEIMKYNSRFNYNPIQPPNITVFDLFEQFLKFYNFIFSLNQQDRPLIQINTFKTQQNKNLNFLTIQDPLIRKIPLNFHTNKTQILTDLFQNFSYKLVNYNMAKLLSEQLDSIFNKDLYFDDEEIEEQLFKANNKINQIQQQIKQYFNIDTDEKVIQQNTVLNKNLENCKILHKKINANIVNVQEIDIQQFEETIQYLNELYKNLNDYYDLQKLQQQYLDESEQQEDFLIEYLDHLTRINDYYNKLQSQQDIIKFLNVQMQQQIKLHSSEVYQQLEKYNQIFQQNTGESLPNFELKKEKNEPKKQLFTYAKDDSEYPQL
ncbi:hypothetical protein PPERSA_04558 [Pseudocohnilembus persalinus]|uniref:Uncharacterized protein n=1 Tax=Pseudocohnilembus persalinus TaxID=266149 RepID=A0A0V0QE81_PSEPJ|nr:hypothetical protein PPERSA_04558 [Pseudocohnilembus persalinus]|eukprot:KRX00537.1 hypothetical protein PPERSA_04558 [Pseudocohnilembus persalinus]